jgi:hypothetical protein
VGLILLLAAIQPIVMNADADEFAPKKTLLKNP